MGLSDGALCTTAEAADLLGVKRQRVDQLYRDKTLVARATGRPKRLYFDRAAVLAYKERREARSTRAKGVASPAHEQASELAKLRELVELINTRLSIFERAIAETEQRADLASTSVTVLESVNDELMAALSAESEAVSLSAQALQRSRDAFEALQRAERLRASTMASTHQPNFPPAG
jgi:excisionase family DNA binding protein